MILEYNLQFFAKDGPGGEKTEQPTAKKLSDARKEGQVAKSKEIANGMGLMALFLVLKMWTGSVGIKFLETFDTIYDRIPQVADLIGGTSPKHEMILMLRYSVLQLILSVLPILLVGYLTAFTCDFLQVKWKPTTKPLKPKFSKLNPISGFKRFFSLNSIFKFATARAFSFAFATFGIQIFVSVPCILFLSAISFEFSKNFAGFTILTL